MTLIIVTVFVASLIIGLGVGWLLWRNPLATQLNDAYLRLHQLNAEIDAWTNWGNEHMLNCALLDRSNEQGRAALAAWNAQHIDRN
jgi:hypothetical protein